MENPEKNIFSIKNSDFYIDKIHRFDIIIMYV